MPRNVPQQSSTCLAPDDLNPAKVCGDSPTVAYSLCSRHNRRRLRNGTLERTRNPPAADPRERNLHHKPQGLCCHPDGCPKEAYADGWCGMHYSRIYKTGDPGPAGPMRDPSRRGRCRHDDGCPKPGNGGDGWCSMHGRRVRKHGDPGPVGPVNHTWEDRERPDDLPDDRTHHTEAIA